MLRQIWTFALILITGMSWHSTVLLASETADQAQPLQPAGKWNINYGDNECILARSFGEGDGAVHLQVVQSFDINLSTLHIIGESLPKLPHLFKFQTSLNGDQDSKSYQAEFFDMKDSGKQIIRIFEPAGSILTSSKSDLELVIKRKNQVVVNLNIGPTKPVIRALNTCVDDLLTSNGVDTKVYRAQSTPPRPKTSPAAWVTAYDYPKDALRKELESKVNFILAVDIKGKITSCKTISNGDSSFEERTCEMLLKRARFDPALDSNNQPIAGYWASNVRWFLPE